MQQISFDLKRYTTPQVKEPKYQWQRVAMDAVEYLENPVNSSVFRWAKLHEGKLKAALEYMQSRRIRNFKYLAKMMSL